MTRVKIFSFMMLFLLANGCKDIYEPDIDFPGERLVVEGLITDKLGPHLVKLTLSSAFGESFRRKSEVGANVRINDSDGQQIQLTEKSPGFYYTPESFIGEHGKTYTLYIETKDGRIYESRPQLMSPPAQITEPIVRQGNKLFYTASGVSRNLVEYSVEGSYVFLSADPDERSSKYRFNSAQLQDYTVTVGPVTTNYCWLVKPVTDYLDRDIGQSIANGLPQEYSVGFVPSLARDLIHMGFPNYTTGSSNTSYGGTKIIMNYMYTLNDDAWTFHDFRNRQLTDEGRFFDPIAAQIPGNVFNPEDPDDVVFGFFEVSSVVYTPVQVNIFRDSTTVRIVHLIDTIPSQGCFTNDLPLFLRESELMKTISK